MECLKHNGLLQIASLRVNEGNESLWLNFISALLRSAYDHMGFLQLTNANKSWESSFRRASKDKHLEGERERRGRKARELSKLPDAARGFIKKVMFGLDSSRINIFPIFFLVNILLKDGREKFSFLPSPQLGRKI